MILCNKRMDPRVTHPVRGHWSSSLPKQVANPIFYQSEDHSLFIGGEEILYHYNFEIMKNYTIGADPNICQGKPYCKNYVTFVGQLLEKLTVCGTNAYNPGCWAMAGEQFEKLSYPWAEQMAPLTPEINHNILIAGDQVYSTLSRKSNNGVSMMKTFFRKIHGKTPLLYTGDKFLRQPKFVKSIVVEKEDKIQDKILLFFSEDNIESRTLEKRLSMVAQLCKEDSGSTGVNTRYVFSTALKARMMCGNQLSGQYYPHLQDIYFLQGKTGNVIYGLFTNSWNHSAVCSYDIEDIENLFKSSSLWGSSKKDLGIRPGTCLPPPTKTPEQTSEEAINHPELTEWLWPLKNSTVMQNLYYYRKMVVDEITAANENIYRILVLATDDGNVHKVVELEDGVVNALEVIPFNLEGKLHFMELKSNTHVLYLGTTHEVARLPLDDCDAYNKSCTDCIQSGDPFCGWINGKCESVLNHNRSMIYQNLSENATCEHDSTILFLKGNGDASTNKELSTTPDSTIRNKGDPKMILKHDPIDGTLELKITKVMYPGEYKCTSKEKEAECLFSVTDTGTTIQCIWILVSTVLLLILM
ncbi:semaphorin-7A [Leptodactylus fuscus]